MSRYKIFLFSLLFLTIIPSVSAQLVETPKYSVLKEDSIREYLDKNQPFFSLFKDNYFIFGTPINHKPTNENSDVKFQISMQIRLTNTTLPWNTYLYFYYTQKVFWHVLEESLPMTDLNFNPGIGLAKPLFSDGRYIGKLSMQLEHESNGKDGDASRSWNRVTFGANIMIDRTLMVHGKVWIPIIDGENNKDILDYCGIYQIGTQVMSENQKWAGSVILVKRRGWKPNYNIITEISYRFSKHSDWSLFAQYYCGYGEGLLDYNKHVSKIRAGIVIRPHFFSDY
ncbi:MAG: phospholipase A [Bacteroidales bacterium]|nr:phospholipase A [Bacteroidales bacterium]